MPRPNVLVLRAPGTNCDKETAWAFERAGARVTPLHVNRLLEAPERLADYQILCVPGGFSFGDDLAAGRILACRFRHHLAEPMRRFIDADRLVLGICNGFQVLIQAGILVEQDEQGVPEATLTVNDSGRFEDRWVRLGVQPARCPMLDGIDAMELPVAHAEGRFVPRDQAALDRLQSEGRLLLRYRARRAPPAESTAAKAPDTGPADRREPVPYPDNPNGSTADVAGICDRTGRVLGLMPHPERHIEPTQHPRWTRGEAATVGDGLAVFHNAVAYFA